MAITISASRVKDRNTVEPGSITVGPPKANATTAGVAPAVTGGAGGAAAVSPPAFLFSAQTPTTANGSDG